MKPEYLPAFYMLSLLYCFDMMQYDIIANIQGTIL